MRTERQILEAIRKDSAFNIDSVENKRVQAALEMNSGELQEFFQLLAQSIKEGGESGMVENMRWQELVDSLNKASSIIGLRTGD